MRKRVYWLGLVCVLFAAGAVRAADLKLWYDHAATVWMTEALPIGNGRIGGMVLGGVPREHIQFNEDSLWTGGNPATSNAVGGATHIGEIQSLIIGGDTRQATALIKKYLLGSTKGFGAYQSFGDLYIDSPGQNLTNARNYRRELDLENGLATVHYDVNGVSFDRQYFCSYPDHVMVLRYACGELGRLNLTIFEASLHKGASITAGHGRLILAGKLEGNDLGFESIAVVTPEGKNATMTDDGQRITIKSADTATILLAAGTGYEGADYHAANEKILHDAAGKSYSDLLADHEKDYHGLFDRVTLDLGAGSELPTDERIANYHNGAADPGLEALFFQYGRYLMISSSRAGGLPANRQGLWNDSNAPGWGSDYPTMMNLEMIYWPVETTNLGECAEPLIDMVGRLSQSGQATAKQCYGARGWTVNYSTNPWGFSASGASAYTYFPAGGAWLCQHLWEHYAFSGDKEYLAKAYPTMKSAAVFWVDHLCLDSDGTLVSCPSESPEHGDFVAGAAMDQEIVWDLFNNTIAAANVLGVDGDFRAKLTDMRDHLSPMKIGKEGQLQEWKADIDDPTDTHKHVSHLWGLFPGHQISAVQTPALAAAARKSLEFRGDGGPGFGVAWKIDWQARLLDGEHAQELLKLLMTPTTAIAAKSPEFGVYSNLMTARPPLQLDAIFGATAGMAEMLLQSQDGEISLLPALPKAWGAGSVTGLRARGGFVVDESWKDGKLVEAVVHSTVGGSCRVRAAETISPTQFGTVAGQSYTIVPTRQ
jgi:alpha-L-fucosidase 2